MKLVSKDKRKDNQEVIVQEFRAKLKPYQNDMYITAAAIPGIKGTGVSVPYQIVLKSDSFDDLQTATKNLTDYLKKKKVLLILIQISTKASLRLISVF